MSETLHDLLQEDDPVALGRIETALQSCDRRNETVETILSALIWRRCTTGQNGVLGAVLEYDCAARVSVLADHLDRIGASDAAQAMRDMRDEIPLADEEIQNGIIDWVDMNSGVIRHAEILSKEVDDIAPQVWSFMQARQDKLPDPEIPDKRPGPWTGFFGRFTAR